MSELREITHEEYLANLIKELRETSLITAVEKRCDIINEVCGNMEYGRHGYVQELMNEIIDLIRQFRINLNESIKVKLTDWGKEIYYHQYDRINQIAGREIGKPMFPKEDENGYTKFQLWCFMELYGEHVGMAKKNVIEPLEIVYKGVEE